MDYISEISKTNLPFPPVPTPLAKRVFDIVVTLLILLLLWPLIFSIIVFMLLEMLFIPSSKGPIFYSETRISKGKPFKIFKFRIFNTSSAQNYLAKHGFIQTKALENEASNLTLTGKILKQIYMDELPQIYNVLKGEMTLVGPRPSNEVVTWEDGKLGHFQRYLFTAGLSGPFQAQKGIINSSRQYELDMEYIIFCKNNNSFKIIARDIKILHDTIFIVFSAKGI